jgi:hypothetical protein
MANRNLAVSAEIGSFCVSIKRAQIADSELALA